MILQHSYIWRWKNPLWVQNSPHLATTTLDTKDTLDTKGGLEGEGGDLIYCMGAYICSHVRAKITALESSLAEVLKSYRAKVRIK